MILEEEPLAWMNRRDSDWPVARCHRRPLRDPPDGAVDRESRDLVRVLVGRVEEAPARVEAKRADVGLGEDLDVDEGERAGRPVDGVPEDRVVLRARRRTGAWPGRAHPLARKPNAVPTSGLRPLT